MMAHFICHKEWTKGNILNDSLLLDSRYYLFANSEPNRKIFVEVSLPWENKIGCPSLTGIPMQFTLLNKLIETHKVQKVLPHIIAETMIDELDKSHVGDSSYLISSRMIKGLKK